MIGPDPDLLWQVEARQFGGRIKSSVIGGQLDYELKSKGLVEDSTLGNNSRKLTNLNLRDPSRNTKKKNLEQWEKD